MKKFLVEYLLNNNLWKKQTLIGGVDIKKLFVLILFGFSMLIGGCGSNSASFVSEKEIQFQKVLYVGTNEKVYKVEKNIGFIQTYSETEVNSNKDSFSNYYPKGTKLYKIPNVSVKDAIAVEIKKNKYIKAVKFN